MNPHKIYSLLVDSLSFEPTHSQKKALEEITRFLISENPKKFFVLKGYAGTGKTSLIKALIQTLHHMGNQTIQLAPTGRAAKVISRYSGYNASTIHKLLYYPKRSGNKPISFTLSKNKFKRTLFIVDEASMLSDRQPDKGLFASDSLLQHLFEYVYSGQGCSLLLIGDTAQLAPVAETHSIALDEQQLALRFELIPFTALLTEVVSQAAESAILSNATRIRDALIANDFQFKLDTTSGQEVFRMQDGSELLEALEDAYREAGMQETAIIVRSNKRANLYNKNIRQRILQLDNELSVGDILMVVKNNYYWLSESTEVAFIANGDAIEVLQIYGFKTLYDFKFAEVQVQLLDYESPPFDAALLLDVLEADQPALSFEDGNKLYQKVAEDYAHESSKYKRYLGIKNNRYFNALQVKYSYAITCHKAQGGQWRRIFVEKPYAPDGLDQDHLKWLYTAFTRASERLYLMGFENDYFYENESK